MGKKKRKRIRRRGTAKNFPYGLNFDTLYRKKRLSVAAQFKRKKDAEMFVRQKHYAIVFIKRRPKSRWTVFVHKPEL